MDAGRDENYFCEIIFSIKYKMLNNFLIKNKMKKLKVVALAAGVLLLAGCGNKVAQNNSTDAGAGKEGAASGMISSIKDAMASGKAMKCTYTTKDQSGGEIVSTTFIDGKKYVGTTTAAGNVQHMIFNEEAMFSWIDGQKIGTKMTTACSNDLAASAPKGQDEKAPKIAGSDPEGTFNAATNVKCEPNNDADFTIPSDITFTDQCEMMKNIMRDISSGAGAPEMPKGAAPAVPEVSEVQQ